MNYNKFILQCMEMYRVNNKQKLGQAIFGTLNHFYPNLANEIKGTGLDCYYKNHKELEPTLNWIKERLG